MVDNSHHELASWLLMVLVVENITKTAIFSVYVSGIFLAFHFWLKRLTDFYSVNKVRLPRIRVRLKIRSTTLLCTGILTNMEM